MTEDVFLLYREISDQHGTDEVVGAYSSQEKAMAAQGTIRDRRSFIRKVPLDPDQVKNAR